MDQVIYFPSWYDYKKKPHIVYVRSQFEDYITGCSDLEELKQGKSELYRVSRCRPFSEELFKQALALYDQIVDAQEKLEKLRKKGKL